MEHIVNDIIKKYYHTESKTITALGGGFYGRVFLAELETSPYKIVIKVYLFNGLADKEKQQIEILSKHAIIKMPEVYFIVPQKCPSHTCGKSPVAKLENCNN